MFCCSGKNKFLRGTLSRFLEKADFLISTDVTVVDISKLSIIVPSSYSSVDDLYMMLIFFLQEPKFGHITN